MYYLYHIPNVKLDISTRPYSAIRKQGYTEYEIISKSWNPDRLVKIKEKLEKELL